LFAFDVVPTIEDGFRHCELPFGNGRLVNMNFPLYVAPRLV
jgi:hypothetical protein